ncbi:MAG: glycerophosphodiester phosphodiesterase, partial [Mogibacterium sp.]|nr:glycerophosphodiester phosphodiesterase [Mogibacterium sp.]
MSRKSKTVMIIILLLMLCLLAGAWLLLFESRSNRAESRNADAAADAIKETVKEGAGHVSEAASSSVEKTIGDWMVADHVYSHRGSEGPNEHSFEAYDAAIEAGSHNIEQDIVISKDGTLYVSHDLTASAMTGDSRAYANMSDSEIDTLTTNNGGRILKLGEVFEHYGDKVRYVVELKSGDDATIDAFKSVVDEHDKAERIIVQCFDISVLEKLEGIYPDMPKLFLCESQGDVATGINSDITDSVCVRRDLVSRSNCDAVHNSGKKFTAWTLDSESDIINAIDVGADAYFTNNTPLALELEKKYRPYKVSDHSTIFFASDYQPEDGFASPKDTLSSLLSAAISDGKNPDEVVLCGDYTNDSKLYN